MYSIRYTIRLINAFLKRFKALILISIGFGALVFFAVNWIFPFLDAPIPKRIGLVGRYTATTLPNNILLEISSGLTKINAQGEPEAALAKSWENSEEGRVWTFTLDTSKIWQDGKKLTSADINYQFSDLTIERPSEDKIVFKLQNPYSSFPSVVSRPTFKKGLLGTNQYEVKHISFIGSYIESLTLYDKKTKQKIIYKFYPTEERAKLAFKLGDVDYLEDLITPDPFDGKGWKSAKLEEKVDSQKYVVVFLNNNNPNLGEKTVRQALTYAVDKDNLSDNRTISPIPKNSWAYNSQVKEYKYDPEKAKGSIKPFSLTLSTSTTLLPIAEKIAKNWNDIGVETSISVYTSVPTDYDALLVIFDAPQDPDQYSIWHSTQTSSNIANYQNARIDKLLEDGRTTLDKEERKKIYFDFQRFLVEDAPAIFLYYPTSFSVARR